MTQVYDRGIGRCYRTEVYDGGIGWCDRMEVVLQPFCRSRIIKSELLSFINNKLSSII